MKVGLGDWPTFVAIVEAKFGAYDYRKVVQELLSLRQEGSVEEYTKETEIAQFQVSMINSGSDDMFFAKHFVNGLRYDIKGGGCSPSYLIWWIRQAFWPEFSSRFQTGPNPSAPDFPATMLPHLLPSLSPHRLK
jgi:hypothetical protein